MMARSTPGLNLGTDWRSNPSSGPGKAGTGHVAMFLHIYCEQDERRLAV